MAKRFSVAVNECRSDGKTWRTTVLADDENEAVQRGVRKLFGGRAELFRDSGLANLGRYGQITVPAQHNQGAYNCVTGRVRVDVE